MFEFAVQSQAAFLSVIRQEWGESIYFAKCGTGSHKITRTRHKAESNETGVKMCSHTDLAYGFSLQCTYSDSSVATGHLYWAVLKRQISAY